MANQVTDRVTVGLPWSETPGTPGESAEIVSATAVELPPGSQPTVALGGTPSERTIEFGIPEGEKGDPGSGSVNSVNGDLGPDIILSAEGVGAVPSDDAEYLATVEAAHNAASQEYVDTQVDSLVTMIDNVPQRTDPRFLPVLVDGVSMIVFAGSSTTSRGGYVESFMGHLTSTWRSGTITSLSAALPATRDGIYGVNAGRGNTTSENYLRPADIASINALNPSIVIHAIGSNDWYYGRSPQQYEQSLNEKINAISSTKPLLHVIVHQHERADSTQFTSPYTWDEFKDASIEVAEMADNRIFVDASEDMRLLGVGMGLDNRYGLLIADNVHLSPGGDRVLGTLVAEKLGLRGEIATDWIDLSSYLAPGVTLTAGTAGAVEGKRSGDLITIRGTGLEGSFSPGTSTNLLVDLPVVISPGRQVWGSAWGATGSNRTGVCVLRGSGSLAVVPATTQTNVQITVSTLY